MASYVWPPGLPQDTGIDYQENTGLLILRSPMDAGPAKMRKRGNRPDNITVSFYMTPAQLDTLATFVNDTIKGTARFDFPHPRTNATVEVRFVPSSDGQLYSISYLSPSLYLVQMSLEVLP
jgi:hypothetical protein